MDDDSYNSAGTITVNGWTVNVPANMLVTFPNMFVSWPEVVAQKDLFLGFEVNVCHGAQEISRDLNVLS